MAVATPTSQIVFSSRLLQQLLLRNEENVFVSPVGVGLALGMAAAGARGKTLSALEHALGVDAAFSANRAKLLFASLDTLPSGLAVELANSLWARSSFALSIGYVAAMRESYRAEVRNVDFTLPGATSLVNDWVANATHGQIANAVDRVDPHSILALINATYFRGLWSDAFDPELTTEHEFTLGSGVVVEAPLMSKFASFEYAEDEDVQAVQLPYTERRFSLLVILPRKVLSPAAFHEVASPNSLARIRAAFASRRGRVRLPKVRLGYAADLRAELAEMGAGPAFAGDADFAGIFDGVTPASISRVLHKTQLEIDEVGTTAAAFTSVDYSLSASIEWEPPKPFEMTVDRPFLIALTESDTDLVLFIGVIGDPTAMAPSSLAGT
jgi:serine protease inhibitor